MIETIAIGITLLLLFIASLIDLKTSEIPEPVSMGLIGILALISLFNTASTGNPMMLIIPLAVGAVYFIFSAALFYMGQWGGGDVKLTAGIGLLVGILSSMGYEWPNTRILPYYSSYWINMMILSVPYVLAYTLFLAALKPQVITRFIKSMAEPIRILLFSLSFTPYFLALALDMAALKTIYMLIPFLVLLTYYLKTVEEVALTKQIHVDQLRLWDIVSEDVVVDGEKIASKRNIEGVDEKQLQKIQKLAGEGMIPEWISIKWGVKFAPILLLALAASLYIGNLLELILTDYLGIPLV